MEAVSAIDSKLFLFLNGLHTDWMDKFMVLITDMWAWFPLYILLICWTVKQYGKRCWWVFLAIGVVVLCSDQISSHLFKPLFHRLRPCFNKDFEGIIHLPKGLAGGRFGFTSSHAANTFAIAAFVTPVLSKYRPWQAIALFLWAIISSYSRIYIGYHYPGDIIVGSILGLLVGFVFWKMFQNMQKKAGIQNNEPVGGATASSFS